MIGAMVNAANADIGFTVDHFIHCQLYAIYRCAAATISFHAFKHIHFLHTQWLADSYCMTHTALWLIRSHYYHFTQTFHSFNQCQDTRRRNAIIIGYENDGLFFLPGLCLYHGCKIQLRFFADVKRWHKWQCINLIFFRYSIS